MTLSYGLASERFCKTGIFLSVVVLHLALNLQFVGPVYLHDEIGYLANAAFFTGSSADAASSYYAGYSLFLIPAFLIFSDSWWLWKAIVTTNAVLFGCSFVLAYSIGRHLLPDASSRSRSMAVLICVLYPAYLTGSGYAFSLPGHLLVFMVAVWCLLRSFEARSSYWTLAHGIACGFVFWVHPTGAAAIVASIVTLALRGWKEPKWTNLVSGVIAAIALTMAYRYVVQPRMIAAMTPAGFAAALHYPSASDTLGLFGSVSSIAEIGLRSAGVVAYLIIASVGFAFWGAQFAWRRSAQLFTSPASSPIGYVSLFCLLTMAGTIVMGASTFTPRVTPVIDTFFYARYAEATVLPLLLFGILFRTPDRYCLAAIFVLITTVLLKANPEFAASPQDGRWRSLNFINATGLWPLSFSLVLPFQVLVPTMFTVGALVVAVVGWARTALARVCLIVAFAVSGALALHFHRSLYPFWGEPGGLPVVVERLWPHQTCVGIDPADGYDQGYKFNLLRYYLRNYDYKRVADWPAQCNGPLLTFRPELYVSGETEVIAKEKRSGLSLVARSGIREVPQLPDIYAKPDACLVTWCLSRSASDLISNVGTIAAGSRKTNGTPGLLLSGPYISLGAGEYTAAIAAAIGAADDAYLEIIDVSESGTGRLARTSVADALSREGSKDTLTFSFKADRPMARVELRLFVTGRSDITVYGYTIVKTSP